MVSGHPKSTGIPRVDGLSTGPPDLGRHKVGEENAKCRNINSWGLWTCGGNSNKHIYVDK